MRIDTISISSKSFDFNEIPIKIELPYSKSISNRLLILKDIYFPALIIHHLSDSNDTKVLIRMLESKTNFNCEDAGTSARFMTARLAIQDGTHRISGTGRMHQRPVSDMVEMLNELGAGISYENKKGYFPLTIKGKNIHGGKIKISSNLSSQFYSAIAMIAPAFETGLQLTFPAKLNSGSYFKMTLNLMNLLGLNNSLINEDTVFIKPYEQSNTLSEISVEKDWSAAGIFILLCKLNPGLRLFFPKLTSETLQEDGHFLLKFCHHFDLVIQESESGISMYCKNKNSFPLSLDFSQAPDQTMNFIVAAAILQKPFTATGIQTLAFKESNRIDALVTELSKTGIKITCPDKNTIQIIPSDLNIQTNTKFETYHDHRLAMAFSLLSVHSSIIIKNPMVVNKSFPGFWNEWEKTIFEISE